MDLVHGPGPWGGPWTGSMGWSMVPGPCFVYVRIHVWPTAQLSRNEIMKYKPSTPFEIDRKLYPKKNIFLFVVPLEVLICSRTTASLKYCLWRQVFVRVETSRSHLVWSAVERNLTFFWLSKQPCPNFVSSATRALYPGVVNQWFPIDWLQSIQSIIINKNPLIVID